jgi:hypothetical protein
MAREAMPGRGGVRCRVLAGGEICTGDGSVANFHWEAIWDMISLSDSACVKRGGAVMVSFKGAYFAKDIILTCVRWYVAYPLSYRQVEELMQERGVSVDHATINRWVLKYSLQLEQAFHRRERPVWMSWRMDETYRYYLEN